MTESQVRDFRTNGPLVLIYFYIMTSNIFEHEINLKSCKDFKTIIVVCRHVSQLLFSVSEKENIVQSSIDPGHEKSE